MQKRKLYLIGVLGVVIAVLVFNIARYCNGISSPLDPENTEEISILVHQGDSVRQIADTLEEKEIIKSAWAFYWYVRLHDLDTTIISGRFLLSPSMTVPEILAKISNPAESEAILTIQEGLRIRDIDKRLHEMELIQEGEFLAAVRNFSGYEYYPFLDKKNLEKLDLPLEGYLYPDTYFLDPIDFKPESVIFKALDNFETKISPYLEKIAASTRSLHEVITMASIVEKEISAITDRPIIAGILWKRLDSDWRLDADATLLYQKDTNKITTEDLQSPSPYNTRKSKGLPPGPIGNPSLNAIQAALNPQTSQYWFYLSAKNGETIYATTNEEHEQNKGNQG
ncbi:MAG: endolytic transglycosylase MltG [Candidatus Gracilibacteria bacterium]